VDKTIAATADRGRMMPIDPDAALLSWFDESRGAAHCGFNHTGF
jgi:hypothetical protein